MVHCALTSLSWWRRYFSCSLQRCGEQAWKLGGMLFFIVVSLKSMVQCQFTTAQEWDHCNNVSGIPLCVLFLPPTHILWFHAYLILFYTPCRLSPANLKQVSSGGLYSNIPCLQCRISRGISGIHAKGKGGPEDQEERSCNILTLLALGIKAETKVACGSKIFC